MPSRLSRRSVLAALAALGAGPVASLAGGPAVAQGRPPGLLAQAAATPFSFDALAEAARRAAAAPYRPPVIPNADVLDRIDYDEHWAIAYRDAAAPTVGPYPVEFFHLGRYAREPVRIFVLVDGRPRAFPYRTDLFDMPADSPAHDLATGAGFAGLRLMRPGHQPDWISFLGASYFRCDGPERQYGLSARGLAVNIGTLGEEEFPRFTTFYVGPAERRGEDAVIYAELDARRCTGAYRFGVHREDDMQRCTVEARIFVREGIERLGVAPLTSMFWYSELNRGEGIDWRPEIHDSDGLAIHTGGGERLWRPLSNPDRILTASFVDPAVRGFGLAQRDRDFANYQDDGVFYHRRPSAWVTPTAPFGPGSVQLLLLPTDDETFDNVVAYFAPDGALAAGDERSFAYTLDWLLRDPPPFPMASVVATYRGIGGPPAVRPRPANTSSYVIDFEGGRLPGVAVATLDVTASGGTVSRVSARPVVGTNRWRGMFDLAVDPGTPVELRAFLAEAGTPLSETWTFLAEG